MFRPEYPRPELKRGKWINLNGEWQFEFDFGNNGVSGCDMDITKANKDDIFISKCKQDLSSKIQVPFCPESKLSGIGYTDFFDACWYKKEVDIPADWTGRTILRFEASYYRTMVFVNGNPVGVHKGGYTPFAFDITDYIVDGKALILVHVDGDARNKKQPSGKQSALRKSFGCFYTRTTGIWQTVWLENVPDTYLEKYKVTPDVDNGRAYVDLYFNKEGFKEVSLTAKEGDLVVADTVVKGTTAILKAVIDIKDAKLWDIDSPNLYDLIITTKTDKTTDTVCGYFGLRKIEYLNGKFLINGKKIFHRMVLDQGYYPDGIYTAPTLNDLENDIHLSKAFGFNGARLHEKVFERNFLYLADKLGYLVWGEYPSWGFDYTDDENTQIYINEWLESVDRDYNHPAIIGWCPMNENWAVNGRQQSNDLVLAVYKATKLADETRPCLDVSWNYHVKTDIFDTHNYCQEVDKFKDMFGKFENGVGFDEYKQKHEGQPYFLSEYGGIAWSKKESGWGYGNAPKTEEEFIDRYIGLSDVLHGNPDIYGLCYTQLYDVEQEQNGLYYYDRTPKFSQEVIQKLAKAMAKPAEYEKD